MSEPEARGADPNDLVVVSGLSGSGKSVALRTLEDLGFYCVDNLPAALLPALAATVADDARRRRLAIGIDVRSGPADLGRLPDALARLAAEGRGYRLVFLDTRDDVLLKRFSETRRRHPLSAEGRSLADAIAEERRRLRPLLGLADRVIDTSDLNVHQLRRLVISELGMAGGPPTLLFESFAYRRGVPADADFVFDARSLPNPHWESRLRPLSGRDAQVREWLEAQPEVARFRDDLADFLGRWLPRHVTDGRSYLTVCVGCTGGRHRSVYLVEMLAARFRADHAHVLTYHREIE